MVAAVMFYLFSFAMMFLGYKWLKIGRWFGKYFNKILLIELTTPLRNQHYMAFLMSHYFRIFLCFELVILFGFLLGMISDSLYPAIPLIVLATIALILTYPTRKRLEQWLYE